jgi:tol-pal system protein YbgF
MHFRSILSGTLAMLLLSGATFAAPGQGSQTIERSGLPGVFQSGQAPEIRVAQATDPRVMQLEEQIRALNGKVEELNFQILQMQEQMRKQQEDLEFRLQELEKKAGLASPDNKVAETPPSDQNPAAQAPSETADSEPALPPIGQQGSNQSAQGTQPNGNGTPPRDFGTITVDKDGNITSSSIEAPVDLLPQGQSNAGQQSDTNVAALPQTNDPEELYRNSYQYVLSGDYANAEAGFRDHIKRFPKDAKAPDANYWLGESLLGQQKYREAAEVFLSASKQYPKSKKGPDTLLKLGVSLVGLKQKDVGCATFNEVGKRYPDASSAIKQRVKQEQAAAAC